MSEVTNLTTSEMTGLLALLNHRYIRIVRDGYPEQSFVLDFHVEAKDEESVTIDAFSKTFKIVMNVNKNHMEMYNTVFEDTPIHYNMRCGYDMFLYAAHVLIMLSSGQDNNPMLIMTILPTMFTIMMKIFTELNASELTTSISTELFQSLLEHTRDISFDENTSIQSRKN